MKSRYLAEGATFPTNLSGDPFGDETLSLEIARNGIRVQGLSRVQRDTLETLFPSFAARESGEADTDFFVFRVPPSHFRRLAPWTWSYSLDFEYGPNHTHVVGMDLLGRIERAKRLSCALWTDKEEPDTFHGAFENFLRVLVAHTVLHRGGALFHSAGVVEDGRAWLFLGHSGAGKSTLSRMALASGRPVVSDDLNLVVPARRGFALAGSPFLGDVGARENIAYPLTALYRLEKGSREDVRPIGKAETLASLFSCAPFVNHSPHAAASLASNLESLVRSVPSYVLTFRREADFWHLLDQRSA
jgi:hypothetical protein